MNELSKDNSAYIILSINTIGLLGQLLINCDSVDDVTDLY